MRWRYTLTPKRNGVRSAAHLIRRVFEDKLEDLPHADDLRDPKTRLQEWLQARGEAPPDYELVNVTGKAHQQRFEVRCLVPGHDAVPGEGRSRRGAEQQAARRMLTVLTAEKGDG